MASSYDHAMAHRFEHQQVIVDVCVEGLFGKWGELYKIKSPNHCIFYGSLIQNPPDDVVSVANFLWYNEALGNIERGYNTLYTPNKNFAKKFLMPIGAKRPWRDHVVNRLDPYLEDAYWSYVRRGVTLPGEATATKKYNQRYFNPMWYDDTCFGVVVESYNGQRLVPEVPVFVTEKTFKALFFNNPFYLVAPTDMINELSKDFYLLNSEFFNLDSFVASKNLEKDFDNYTNKAKNNLPKLMEYINDYSHIEHFIKLLNK
jgi:hypothetical protein